MKIHNPSKGEFPELFIVGTDTECAISDEVLGYFREEGYDWYEVVTYRRGGQGDCEKLYWSSEFVPKFWVYIDFFK